MCLPFPQPFTEKARSEGDLDKQRMLQGVVVSGEGRQRERETHTLSAGEGEDGPAGGSRGHGRRRGQ